MKQKLLNKFWLRVGMIVAVMTTALAGTAGAEDVTWSHTFAQGELSKTAGSKTLSEKIWTQSAATYIGWDASKGVQIGSGNNPVTSFSLSTTAFSDYTITKITVNSSIASSGTAKLSISVGNTTYLIEQSLTATSTDYSCTPNVGGDVVISWTNTAKAFYIKSISITYTDGGGSQAETVATPTFSVAEGTYTSAQSVTISTETSGATIYYTTDGSDPTTSSTVYSTALTIDETTTVKAMAVKEGMNNSSVASATYTISLPYSGPDYVRVTSLDYLTNGAKVIIAARFSETQTTDYHAMTATTSGKPAGVIFGSTTSSNGEILPAKIVDNESTYCWTVGVTSDGYTFTNANDQKLGYSSSTNFATNGDNTVWTISRETAGSSAMVSEYEGFYIINKNITARGIALNSSMNFGPYDKSNNNSKSYNFYLDIFVQGAIPSTNPSITAANVEIAYDATSGEIEYTISNPDGSTLTAAAAATDTWITNVTVDATNSKVTFATTANSETTPRTGTITLTYGSVTKDVTVTQAAAPQIYTTIPALFAAATSTATDVNVTFGSWVVSGVSGSNAYLTDNQGNGLIIYASGHGFEVGDVLTGTVSCKLQLYRGSAELTNLTNTTTGLTVTSGGSVTEATIAMADLAGVNTGALVSYENLTCSVTTSGNYTNYDLTDGTTTIRAYTTLYDFTSTPDLEDGKTYNIKGIFLQYTTSSSSTKEILPRSAADIEEVVSTTPSIVVDPDEVSEDAEEHEGTLDVTYENLTITDMSDFGIQFYDADNNELNGDDAPDWIEILVAEAEGGTSYVVSYYMLDNDGAARTAYFKVFAMGTEDFVYSNLVTVTQAAFVAPPTPITTNGNYFVKVTSTADITDGAYLIVYEDGGVAFDGSLETLDAASNTIEVTIKNGVIAANSTNKAAAFFVRPSNNTLMTQSGKYVGRTANSNGLNVDDSELTNTFSIDDDGNAVITASGNCTMKYNSASDQLRFRYYKSGQKAIQLYKLVDEAAGLNSEGYATFASTSALDFSGATDYTAWAITGVSGTDITFSQITGAVPAGTGVLLKGTASTPVVLTTTTGATTAVTGNKLVGITTATAVTAGQYYGLKGNTFVKVNGGNVPAGRALLPASVVNGTSPVNAFTFSFDEDATAIKAIENGQLTTDGVIYNVAGQRLGKMQKGINIVNGKKILK